MSECAFVLFVGFGSSIVFGVLRSLSIRGLIFSLCSFVQFAGF